MFKAPFYSLKGVVASEHPLASLIGSRVLEKGNSIDSAVTTSLVLAVTLPHLGDIGGDFFALLRDPDGRVYFVDGSGYAPSKLTRELLLSLGYKSMPLHGPLSINVPGMVDGLRVMWKKWGVLEWSEIVGYAREIACKGYAVTRSLALALKNLYEELSRDKGSRETYYANGVPVEGEIFTPKGLCKTLELVGEDPRSFYEGEIAEAIASYIQGLGGVLDYDDLKNYRAEIRDPIKTTYRGRTVYEMPPSTQGITTLHALKLVEGFDLKSIGLNDPRRIELLLKSAIIAYKVRDEYVTDPRYMLVSLDYLLGKEFLEKMRREIDNALELGVRRNLVKGEGDTTFFAIAGGDGWVIAGIQSLFYPFGSYITVPGYGITLNSRASSFSLREDHVNRLEPLKKTMHTLSAIILEDYDRVMAIGLSGGHYRPLLHVQLLTNIVDYNMHPQETLEYPRFIWHLWTNKVEYEKGLKIKLPGYNLVEKPYPSRLGVAAIVEVKGRVKAGYTDVRGDGLPIGLA